VAEAGQCLIDVLLQKPVLMSKNIIFRHFRGLKVAVA
jgi:hypothetical protein